MKIQQKCAERLYELLPHKKELEFGTAWEDEQAKWVYVAGFSITTSQIGGWTSMKPEESQIIGQPLRLAEILIATERRWRTMYGVNPIDGLKRDVPLREGVMLYEICSKYDLYKDNILDQSDEFCEFVLELLK